MLQSVKNTCKDIKKRAYNDDITALEVTFLKIGVAKPEPIRRLKAKN